MLLGVDRVFVLDVGTVSGAIALALAHERPCARVVATDVSAAARDFAQANALRLEIRSTTFVASAWYHSVGTDRFDLIVSGTSAQLEAGGTLLVDHGYD